MKTRNITLEKVHRIYTVGSKGHGRAVGVTLPPDLGLKVGDQVRFSLMIDGKGKTVGAQIVKIPIDNSGKA